MWKGNKNMNRAFIALIPLLVGFSVGVPSLLPAQTEYAVIVREAGTRKTYVGDGTTTKDSHDSRLFGVARIDFSNAFARAIGYRAVLHARKIGRQNIFAPRPLADEPEYLGTSYLLNGGGRTGLLDMQVFVSQDPLRPAWIFPQGKAVPVQLVNAGTTRLMALRSTSPFAWGLAVAEEVAVNANGIVFTLEAALSRELNALSPGSLLDARTKLINLLSGKGWVNAGEDAF